MRTPILVGAAVAALLLSGGGVALAQTTPAPSPTCGEALLVLAQAQNEHRAAVDADKAAAVATAADTALADAPAVVVPDTATTDAGTIAADKVTTQNRADINAALTASIAADNADKLTTDSALTVKLKAALATADNSLKLQAEAKSDAVALRRVASETDAVALKTKLDEARATADKACAAPTTAAPTATPTATPAPSTTPAGNGPLYATCAEATAAGAAPMNVGEPGYRLPLDSDADGVACEVADDTALPVGGAATGG